MIKEMINTIKNEFNVMLREKMILIVVLIIPILISILVGIEFKEGVINNIQMAVIDNDNTQLSRMITEEFRNSKEFDIKYYLKNDKEIKELLDNSKIYVGLIIPDNFSKDVANGKSPTVLILYDGSYMSIASVAKAKANEILLSIKTGVTMKIVEAKLGVSENIAKNIAMPVMFTNRTLYNPQKNFKYFLNTGLAAAIVQSGLALMVAASVRKKEISNKKSLRIGYIIGKVVFYGIIGFLALIICVSLQTKVFNVPMRGTYWDMFIMSIMFTFAVSSVCVMISAMVTNKTIATIIAAILFVPNTIMIGYTWPVISMPVIYQNLAKIYPFYYYADNLRDICLQGKTLISMKSDLIWLALCILVCITVSTVILMIFYNKDKSSNQKNKVGDGVNV